MFKHYLVHPQVATTPALAVCAAGEQGKFFEMERMIWETAWELEPQPRLRDPNLLNQESMEKLAAKLGLEVGRFKADMAGEKCRNDLANDQKALSAVGTRGTPAFYINGRFLSGAQPIEQFKTIIDQELKKAEAATKQGVKPEEYYQTMVVARGKKSVQ